MSDILRRLFSRKVVDPLADDFDHVSTLRSSPSFRTGALQIHLSRPLYPLLASSPLASRHLLRTLYILLLHFGAYVPPVSTLSAAAALGGPPGRAREASRIPRAALRARGVLDRILNEGCFVGLPHDGPGPVSSPSDLVRINSPRVVEITTAAAATDDLDTASLEEPLPPLPPHLADLHARFAKTSSARPLRLAVPASAGGDLVGGTIIVPGWVRERVAEELVAGRATDDRRQEREEQSVVELVLSVLEKVSRSLEYCLLLRRLLNLPRGRTPAADRPASAVGVIHPCCGRDRAPARLHPSLKSFALDITGHSVGSSPDSGPTWAAARTVSSAPVHPAPWKAHSHSQRPDARSRRLRRQRTSLCALAACLGRRVARRLASGRRQE